MTHKVNCAYEYPVLSIEAFEFLDTQSSLMAQGNPAEVLPSPRHANTATSAGAELSYGGM